MYIHWQLRMQCRRSAASVVALTSVLLVLAQLACDLGEPRNVFRSLRDRFKLRKLVDFSHFKTLFHKTYRSISEELVRQRIYSARAMRAFVSEFAYRSRRSPYYLSVNPMSDWTDAELAKLDTYRSPIEAAASSSIHVVVAPEQQSGNQNETPHVGPRQKRSLFRSRRKLRRGSLELSRAQVTGFQPVARTTRVQVVRPNTSQGTPSGAATGDVLHFDHRSSNCLGRVQNQGKCGSCYAFATAAFFEWSLCKQTGKQVKLSEQYVIDCGPETKLKFDLDGCSGGSAEGVAEFLAKHGAELSQAYPYVGSEGKCPYDTDAQSADHMGHLRLGQRAASGVKVNITDWDYFLRYAPIIVGVATTRDFREYGGGVHVARDCCAGKTKEQCAGHGMLLVGHGTDSGEHYWLMRNSYSDQWGEQGYYRLSKSTDCIQRDYGLMFATSDGHSLELKLAINTNRSAKVDARIRDQNRYSTSIDVRG